MMTGRTKALVQIVFGLLVAGVGAFTVNPHLPEPVFYGILIAGMLTIMDGCKRLHRRGRTW